MVFFDRHFISNSKNNSILANYGFKNCYWTIKNGSLSFFLEGVRMAIKQQMAKIVAKSALLKVVWILDFFKKQGLCGRRCPGLAAVF